MPRRVLNWLADRLRRRTDASDGEESGDSEFVPSVLDASVRHAHGDTGAEIEREIDAVREEARRIEEHRDE